MPAKNKPDAADEPEVEILEAPLEAEGSPMGALAQYERNMKIVAAKIRRTPWSEIAKEHRLTKRRCQQIWDQWRAVNPTLRDHDPIEIVDELLYGYQATLEDLEATVQASDTDSPVRVAALNGKLRVFREMAELLQAIGVLPNDLGTLKVHVDGQVTAERVITVLEKFKVPEEVYEAMLTALGGPPTSLAELGTPGAN